jgi:hypothetical protein
MKLEIGNNQGYVIIEDDTGKILSVLVKKTVKNKFDFINTKSYTSKNNKHKTI